MVQNGMNKTYSVELWAAVLESYGQEALREETIEMYCKLNTHFPTPYAYIL